MSSTRVHYTGISFVCRRDPHGVVSRHQFFSRQRAMWQLVVVT
jgi:hypothetical protein